MQLTELEKRAEKAEDLQCCHGLKLTFVREKVEELLGLIGKDDFFNEYTKHDIKHIEGMLNIIQWLIPESTQQIMTDAEYLMLVLAVYFHDMGMLVTKDEYQNRNNTDFVTFKENYLESEYVLNLATDEDKEKFIYQEYVRKTMLKELKIGYKISGKKSMKMN